MSISAIPSSIAPNQVNILPSLTQQQRTEFQQLTQALQSGSLTKAQQAVSSLTSNTTSFGILSAQLTQDLSKLASALQSGKLTSARQAYSSVQQILQNSSPMAAHHHRPHHGEGGAHRLTSGFPADSSTSAISAARQSSVFQPVNLIA